MEFENRTVLFKDLANHDCYGKYKMGDYVIVTKEKCESAITYEIYRIAPLKFPDNDLLEDDDEFEIDFLFSLYCKNSGCSHIINFGREGYREGYMHLCGFGEIIKIGRLLIFLTEKTIKHFQSFGKLDPGIIMEIERAYGI